jgi:uncharacterized protein (DUF362 family)
MQDRSNASGGLPSRRGFLGAAVAAGTAVAAGAAAAVAWHRRGAPGTQPGAILRARGYDDGLRRILRDGLAELAISPRLVAGRRVVLKPNLVEPSRDAEHINTHPLLIQAAVELFRSLGAASVVVAEGAGHVRDPYYVLEESGLLAPLAEGRTPFVDLNFAPVATVDNRGRWTRMPQLVLPRTVLDADILVSMPKMKTHHWAGVTLAMKNLFGIMPGVYYGWPKNVLHDQGLLESILDINATVSPHLAIVDGVVGMGGDGPIMGTPVRSHVIVMGTNMTSVDATCARIMGLSPEAVSYLARAAGVLGPIDEGRIEQRGEAIASVRTAYPLLEFIPAQRDLRG